MVKSGVGAQQARLHAPEFDATQMLAAITNMGQEITAIDAFLGIGNIERLPSTLKPANRLTCNRHPTPAPDARRLRQHPHGQPGTLRKPSRSTDAVAKDSAALLMRASAPPARVLLEHATEQAMV